MRAAVVRTLLNALGCLGCLGLVIAGPTTHNLSLTGAGLVLGSTLGLVACFDALATVYQHWPRRLPLLLLALTVLCAALPGLLGAAYIAVIASALVV